MGVGGRMKEQDASYLCGIIVCAIKIVLRSALVRDVMMMT